MHSLTILAAEDSSGGSAAIIQLGIFLLIPIAMYFLLIRPQRRRQREQAALTASIEVGDEVMTTTGIYGFVTAFEGDIAWLEVDNDVQIRITRAAIARRVDTGEGATSEPTAIESRSTDVADAAGDDDES